MIQRRHLSNRRHGVAAVELAFVTMLFIVPLLLGLWEVGRLIQVQQIVSNSAREGARLAAQGFTVTSSGAPTQIMSTDVTNACYNYLIAAGLTNLQKTDITVTFTFTSGRTTDYIPISTDPVGTSYPAGSKPPDPCYGEKNQTFTVTVTINDWAKVRWVNLGLIKPTTVTFTVGWQMLTDDPFIVSASMPTW